MKAVRPVTASNGVPYLQMRSVGPHSKNDWLVHTVTNVSLSSNAYLRQPLHYLCLLIPFNQTSPCVLLGLHSHTSVTSSRLSTCSVSFKVAKSDEDIWIKETIQ